MKPESIHYPVKIASIEAFYALYDENSRQKGKKKGKNIANATRSMKIKNKNIIFILKITLSDTRPGRFAPRKASC
ncbi:MAG: hypothetical protein EOM46_18430 [Gammaproteobacteria bacterium]|uniref:Uncharacterized protein n=1 Tax=Tolumonas osonensis TaxID=675874 RepID=A0A841GCG6_9GAMM|nr:hypothetical protein [Tolumonas osonensis]MBB6056844.1 hypothetical protein [Tolumonas osonensis]NCB59415.1 hypothetical protein [Gammaproteobacteria bacterium]